METKEMEVGPCNVDTYEKSLTIGRFDSAKEEKFEILLINVV